jgi:hypothetical protein
VGRQTRTELWPQPGGEAVICCDGGRVVAEVTSATRLSIRLRADDAPRAERVLLEYVAGERAYRLAGELDGRDPDGDWRFVPRAQPVLLERREHMRTAVSVTIVLTSADGSVRLVGRTRNLSAGGALVELDGEASAGDRLRFSLVPRVGAGVLKGACRVVRVAPGGVTGVAFENVPAEQADQLAAFILRHRA